VLLDDEKRKIYDETGVVPGDDGMGDLSGVCVCVCVCVLVCVLVCVCVCVCVYLHAHMSGLKA
jgi:hypothetical protein